jgi:cysteine desulfurase/selenocysteine lyase
MDIVIPAREVFIRDFPVLEREINGKPIVYLDNASTSLTPRDVVAAIARYYLQLCGTVHRGQHALSEETSEAYEAARQEVAHLLGCAADEIIFVRNATEALNLTAQCLEWNANDEVIIGGEAHHSNQLPWRRVAQTAFVHLDRTGIWDLNEYDVALKRRPKLVALTHVSNVTGIYQPVTQLISMARQAGSLVVLDASQSIPHRRLNVRELNVDFLAFSGHKLLGPTGIGVLFASREQQRRMQPLYVGGGSVEWVDESSFRSRSGPHGFEAGTPNIAGALGLSAAIQYLNRIGWPALANHEIEMAQMMYREARKREHYLELMAATAHEPRAGIISFRLRGNAKVDDIARILSDSFGVMCRSGHLCAQPLVDRFARRGVIRASVYIYNTRSDVQRMFDALDEIASRLTWDREGASIGA